MVCSQNSAESQSGEVNNLDAICGMLEDLSAMLDQEIIEERYK